VTGTQNTILVSDTATGVTGTSYIYFKPTLNLQSSVLWEETLSEQKRTTSISNTDTIISEKLVSGNTNTAVQTTATVSSIYTSPLGISQTLLAYSVAITSPTRATKDSTTSKSTTLIANTSYMTMSTRRDGHVTEATIKTVTPSQPFTGSVASSVIKGMGKTSRGRILKAGTDFV